MKLHRVLSFLAVSTATALAQGTLDFSNYKPGRVVAPVFDVDATNRLGDQFLGQLYGGTHTNTLVAIGAPAPFRNHAGTNTGYVVAGRVDVPGAPAGTVAWVELRAWEAGGGSSFEAAVVSGAKVGRSPAIEVTLGGDGTPPTPPTPLIGLPSFSLNRRPVSSGFGATTPKNQPLIITFVSLLTPITDPDDDPIRILSVGQASHAALVVTDGVRVTYTPDQDFAGADQFAYVVSDSRGAENTVLAQVAVLPAGATENTLRGLVAGSLAASFDFAGIPGRSYHVQRTESLPGSWVNVGSLLIGPNGITRFTDTNPPSGSAFYRTLWLP